MIHKIFLNSINSSNIPESFRRDGDSLRPQGAGNWHHEDEEAPDPHHLERGVEGRAGLEPSLCLQLLHDDGQGEHAGGGHGYPGGHNLQYIIAL